MEFPKEFDKPLKELYSKPCQYDPRVYLDPDVFKHIIKNEIADCEYCLQHIDNLYSVELTENWLAKLKELLELHEQIPY